MLPLVMVLLLSSPGGKGKASEPVEAVVLKRAKQAFDTAQKLYKKGKYAEAVTKFEEAYALKPHPSVFYNIGKCYEQLGEAAKALRAFRDYLRLSPSTSDKETVAAIIASLERRLEQSGVQQLLVLAEPLGAEVSVDGKDLGRAPTSIELTPGSHRLVVSAPDYETSETDIVMPASRSLEVSISLRVPAPTSPVPPPPPPPSLTPKDRDEEVPEVLALPPKASPKPRLKWTWVAGGLAVAGVGAGVGLGLAANGASNQLLASQHPQTEAQALADQTRDLATGANVAYGVAVGAAVTAVILFFVEGT